MRISVTMHDPDPETLALLMTRFTPAQLASSIGESDPVEPSTVTSSRLNREDKRRVLAEMFKPNQRRRLSIIAPLATAAPERVQYDTLLQALSADDDTRPPNSAWGGVRSNINAAYRKGAGTDLVRGSRTTGFWM